MRSMTGYGHWAYRADGYVIESEIKSYNNRYLEISKYLSPVLQVYESHIDEKIKSVAKRGHIEFSLKLRMLESEETLSLDKGLLSSYISVFSEIGEETGLKPAFSDYASIDGLIAHDKETDAERYKEGLDECLEHCLSMLDEAKDREGEGTKQDLSKLGSSFEESLEFVEARADELEEHYSKLLQDKFSKLSGDKPDQAVFMTELAAILVRYSINEEVSRLKVHLKEYWKLLSSSEPVGKKLDFLCQEMQRECNTIASKSQLVEINLAVVNMKDNIEDIREQVRNIE